MAKHPHQDKKSTPSSATPKETDKGAKPDTPVPVVPNLSLDDEPVMGEIEPEIPQAKAIPMALPAPSGSIPVAHAVPSSSVEAEVVADADMLDEEVVEAMPVEAVAADSDIFLADDVDEVSEAQAVPDSETVSAESASAVVPVDEVVLADEDLSVQPMDSPIARAVPPISGFQETEAVVEAEPQEEVLSVDDVELVGSSAALAEPVSDDPVDEVSQDSFGLVDEPEQAEEVAVESPANEDFTNEIPVADSSLPPETSIPLADEIAEPVDAVESEDNLFAHLAEEPVQGFVLTEDDVPSDAIPVAQVAFPVPQADAATQGDETAQISEEVAAEAEPAPAFESLVEPTEPEAALPADDEIAEPMTEIAVSALMEENAEAEPGSAVVEDAGVLDDEDVGETVPASAVAEEEIAEEVAPVSDVAVEETADDAEIAETAPASRIQADDVVFDEEEIAEAAPASAVMESEEIAEAAPASEVLDPEEISDAAPASAIAEDEGILEDEPIAETEAASEVAEAAPASGVQADDIVFDEDQEIAEAAPVSSVMESAEIAEAAPASGVLAEDALEEEAIAEAAPASAVQEAAPASDVAADAFEEESAEEASEEVLDEDDVAEATPASAVASEVPDEEIAEAAPASEVMASEEAAETAPGSAIAEDDGILEDEPIAETEAASEVAEAVPASEVMAAEEIAEATPASGVQADDVVFDEEEIAEAAPASAVMESEEIAEAAPASGVLAEDVIEEEEEIAEAAPASTVQEAAPTSDVAAVSEEVLDEDDVAEAAPASAVAEEVLDEEIAEAAPASAIAEDEGILEDEPVAETEASEIAEAAPASEVMASEEIADATPASGVQADDVVFDEEEIAEAAPASAVMESEEITEAAPASGVLADDDVFAEEEVAEAAPASALEAEEVAAESASESGVVTDALFEEMDADAPSSAVEAGSEIVEVEAEEESESAIDEDEEIEEADEASAISAVAADDLFEEEAEAASSSMTKSEEALDEDALAADFADSAIVSAESASAVVESEDDATEFIDEPLSMKAPVREKQPGKKQPSSETVAFDDVMESPAPKGKQDKKGKKAPGKKADLEQTVAFESTHVADDDDLTNAEASAVQLGEMPSRKGASISGIDPVAEALESGVGIDEPKTGPSVEFDEILDDSVEGEITPPKSKKDAKDAKKGKKSSIAQTGDDVDLFAMYGEEETEAEPVEAEAEAEEAEADDVMFDEDEIAEAEEEVAEAEEEDDVAFDEEVAEAEEEIAEAEEEIAEAEEEEIAEADDDGVAFDEEEVAEAEEEEVAEAESEAEEVFDEEEAAVAEEEDEVAAEADEEETFGKKPKTRVKPKPSGKKPYEEDEELADEEDDAFAKKGKKAKEKEDKKRKPDAPAAPARGGKFVPMILGLILGIIFIGGGLAAAGFFAPNEVREYSELVLGPPPKQTVPIKPPPPLPKSLQAREAMEKGNYKEAVDLLATATEPVEVSTRGEAKWLEYLKTQKDKIDRKDKAVEEAIKDAKAGKNDVLVAQINNTFDSKKLKDLLDNKENNLKEFEQAKLDKEKAEKLIDDAKNALVMAKVVAKAEDIDDAMLVKVLTSLGTSKSVLDAVNKLLKDANINDEGDTGVKTALKARQESEDKLNAVDDILKKENVKGKGADGLKEIVKKRSEEKKDFEELLATVEAAFQELVDASIVPKSDRPRDELTKAVKIARQKAESPLSISLAQLGMSLGGIGTTTSKTVQETFDLSKTAVELLFYKGREPLIQTPEQKLDNYVLLLQDRRQNNADKIKEIMGDVEWVLSDKAKEHAEARGKAMEHAEAYGKALYVKGLALRNLEQFDPARAALADALKKVEPLEKVDWKQVAQKSELELKDPTAYYIPRIEEFSKEKNWKRALDEAALALKAMPKSTMLHAQSAQIRYEMVRGQGGKIPEETRKAIRDDAEAAAADKADLKIAARSAYLLGLLEEELGNLKKAESLYREARDQAKKANPEIPHDVGVYNDALGNLLLRDNAEPAVDNNNKKNDDEKKKDDKIGYAPAVRERTLVIHPWSVMVVNVTVAQAPDKDEDPKNDPKLQEVMKLANELIASDKKELKGKGYVLLGQVLAKQGDRTEGLKAMAKGLELLYPGKGTSELINMLEDHPGLQQPDIANIQNSDIALRHYGEGLDYYWERKYAEAEAQFKLAIRYDNRDARYQYFYGLAMWGQKSKKKREAAMFAFEQGARLEAKSNPTIREINLSLERIQGDLRQTLNSYRYRNLAPPPDQN